MLSLETLSTILDEFGGAPVSVHGERCLNFRHKDANCRLCVDSCPTEAIRLQPAGFWPASSAAETTALPPGPKEPRLDAERCVSCGLCLHLCPTEAFTQRGTPESTTAQTVALTPGDAVALVCPQHPEPDRTRAPVDVVVRHKRCLAALSISRLLELSDGGRRAVWLDDSPCAECPIGRVQPLIARAVTAANEMLQAFGRAPRIRTHQGHDGELLDTPTQRRVIDGDRPELSRRHFFETLGQLMRRTAVTAIAESLPTPTPSGPLPVEQRLPQRIPQERQRLFRQLKRLGTPVVEPLPAATVPFAEILIDGDACSACRLCARFCPTGALHFATDAERFALYVKPALCLDCGLCAAACPENAIRFGTAIAPEALIADRWKLLATGRLAPCIGCGEATALHEAAEAEAEDEPWCHVCRYGGRTAMPSNDIAALIAGFDRRPTSMRS